VDLSNDLRLASTAQVFRHNHGYRFKLASGGTWVGTFTRGDRMDFILFPQKQHKRCRFSFDAIGLQQGG